jgi:murein DD-endopeptidase MepM/ murein hydrolase activator NlpD
MPAPEPAAGGRVVGAILAGLAAAAVLIAFVYLQAGTSAAATTAQPQPAPSGPPASAPAPSAVARLVPVSGTLAAGAVGGPDGAGADDGSTLSAAVPLTATAPVTVTAKATGAVSATIATTASLGTDLLHPPAPFFTYRRPFSPDHAVEASRYYPYGTTGRGAYLLHHGVDIGNQMGTPVLAIGPGVVEYAGDDTRRVWGPYGDFYGNVVVIRHPDSLEGQPVFSLYGHLSEVDATAGQTVAAGDVIGKVGMAGIALGPHLHLEVRLGEADYESTRNIELFLAPLAGRGTIVGRLLDRQGAPAAGRTVGLYRLADDGSQKYVAETSSYPGRHVHPSAELGENFLFADIPAGRYRLAAGPPLGVTAVVTVTDGGASAVTLQP